ncbi:MAG: sodium:alanine symporter family protein [Gemmatimonadetes bacterium]|nr:sodium:alanine symporter family protein [Gemmatimonadota bacterium]
MGASFQRATLRSQTVTHQPSLKCYRSTFTVPLHALTPGCHARSPRTLARDGGENIPFLVALLLGTGFYLTVYLGFVQLRKPGHGFAVMLAFTALLTGNAVQVKEMTRS